MEMNKSKVGAKVEALRQSRNLSVEELAERSGLSTEQINHIEKDEHVPSLSPLIKIARVLGVRLGTFLDDNNDFGPIVCRSGEHADGISFSNNDVTSRKHMDYYSLAKQKSGRHMEPFIINIEASEGADFVMSTHEGEEFIFVLDGVVEINYGKHKYILEEGDSIYYDSIVAHHVHAAPGNTARILAVVYTPI